MEPENKNMVSLAWSGTDRENGKGAKNERHKWLASLEDIFAYILKQEQSAQATRLLDELTDRLRESGLDVPRSVNTPYINTIAAEKEPAYPGNREIERRIKSY